ncbi:MAG: hypothetical protein IKD70_02700, partial [Eggerthellaceae bacterium]|nr:hypothetical protein [Eggerthellaceae bacterium]
LLNIDENARKEHDPAWKRTDGAEEPLTSASVKAAAAAKAPEPARGRAENPATPVALPWRKRLLLSLLVAGFAGFTLGIAAPLEIIARNVSSVLFGVGDIWAPMVVFSLVGIVILALALSALRGRAFSIGLALVFSVGLCCWVQAMFLNAGLPSANGRAVDFAGEFGGMMVLSGIVWAAIILIAVVASGLRPKLGTRVCAVLAACLILVQGVGLTSAIIDAAHETGSDSSVATEDGLYTVSGTDNVIVFILDAFDTATMKALTEDPQLADIMLTFGDFTWYQNATGKMQPTFFALPYLLTGIAPRADETISDYRTDRYADSTFLTGLAQAGIRTGVYTDTLEFQYLSDTQKQEHLVDPTINVHGISQFSVSWKGAILALSKVALYRDMPWALKERFWFHTDYLNRRIVESDISAAPDDTMYIIDDVRYFARMQTFGLSVGEGEDGTAPALRIIHLNGAHFPWRLDANGTDVGTSTLEQQAAASLLMVKTYIGQLQQLGLYDSATIIVTADHGAWGFEIANPILLVKPAGQRGGNGGPAVSMAPVSHEDFCASILDAFGMDWTAYGKPWRLWGEDEVRSRITYVAEYENDKPKTLVEYRVDGFSLDPSSWTATGNTWNIPSGS